jgi:phosphate transport system permease protein
MKSMALYGRRRVRNSITMGLSVAATVFGASWLVIILGTLLWHGFAGLSLSVFTMNTPAAGSPGGLANAIVGSLVLTFFGIVLGTPIGILAGTYMAEYGRYARLSIVVRFVNDILLSAPSIVVGLFVYEVLVVAMGHFSAWAGGVALAMLVIPVVVRTTEDMLVLVPNSLREAATALGAPRWKVIMRRLSGGARGHRDRHPPRRCPHHRRDGAAPLHRPQQPVLEPQSEPRDGQPAGDHLPVRVVGLR